MLLPGSLVKLALDANLIPFTLDVLDKPIEVEHPAAVKAQLVKALKAMTRDPVHGEAARQLLDASSVWASFRDQRHDLFLTHETVRGLLTGPTGPATRGYITSGNTSAAAPAGRITAGSANAAYTVSNNPFAPPPLQ